MLIKHRLIIDVLNPSCLLVILSDQEHLCTGEYLSLLFSLTVTWLLAVTPQEGLWGRHHLAVSEKLHSFSFWPLILATLEEWRDILRQS